MYHNLEAIIVFINYIKFIFSAYKITDNSLTVFTKKLNEPEN